jgi:Na+-translocating ferredoxin:NAD+ oxidoreductase RnfC subunit
MDCYPAGDEFVLVYDVTGRVIPPGGLPRDVGCVVVNVETLVNIGSDKPVTHKYLTVAGAVRTPVTLRVPVGLPIREVIDAAGGAAVPMFRALMGGVMMARLAADLDEPVTKTTGGVVVLPSDHFLIRWHQQEWRQIERIAKSACDQCRFCTEMCPRYLLGHPIQPHCGSFRLDARARPGSQRPTVCARRHPGILDYQSQRSLCRGLPASG